MAMNSLKNLSNKGLTLWTKYKNWVLFILFCLLIGIIVFRKPHPTPIIPVDTTNITQQAEILKDKNDKLSAVITQYVVDQATQKKFSDSLAKALRLKPKQIVGVGQSYYKHDTIFTDTGRTKFVILNGDTSFVIEHHDNWIDLVANARKNGGGTISLSSRDTLTRTEVVKNPLFGKTIREIIIRNSSPYNKLNSGYDWTVKEKRAWLTVGPYIGIDVITLKPSFGVSAQLPLIQLKK